MVKLPVISGSRLAKALSKIGYVLDHTSGDHMILYHPEKTRLSIPKHKEIGKGLLHNILRDAGISADRLRELL